MTKNEYSNGYHLSPIVDGHDWGPIPRKPWADGAQCRVCQQVASNAEIARGDLRIKECTAMPQRVA